jgi:hypothetical protein
MRAVPKRTDISAHLRRISAVALVISGAAHAQAARDGDQLSDREFRQQVEAQIQDCAARRVATPEVCRMTAYKAALAAGFSPEAAARLTGYRPKPRQ